MANRGLGGFYDINDIEVIPLETACADYRLQGLETPQDIDKGL